MRTPKAMPMAVSRWMFGRFRVAMSSPPITAPPPMREVRAE